MQRILITCIVLFTCCIPSFAQGPIAHWKFDGNTSDATGNGMHATPHNCTPVAGISGAPNTAYQFDGTSSYMDIAYHPLMNLTKFSIVATIRVDGFYTGLCQCEFILFRGTEFAAGNYGFNFSDNAFDGNDCVAIDTNNYVFTAYATGTASSATGIWQYTSTINSHTWYTAVVTYDSLFYRIYVDGQLMNTVASTGAPILASTEGMIIGRNYTNYINYPYWFDGLMDDLQLYNRVLDSAEIAGMNCMGTDIVATQPQDSTVNPGNNASFDITTITAVSQYQWQVDTGIGFINIPNPSAYLGVNSATLTALNPTIQMDSNMYRCIVTNGFGCSDTSDGALLRVVDTTTGVTAILSNNVHIYPNPSSGSFTVKLIDTKLSSLSISDMAGRIVHTSAEIRDKMVFDLKLPKGIYLLRLSATDGAVATKKLLIQ